MVDNYQTTLERYAMQIQTYTHTQCIDTYSHIPRPGCRRRKSGLVCTIHPCVTNTMLFFFFGSVHHCIIIHSTSVVKDVVTRG